MLARQVIKEIESTADPDKSESWDLSGIQVLGTKEEINKLGVALDPSKETINQALKWQADFILTHHPLTLKPQLPNQKTPFTDLLRMTLSSGTWLYSAHTSLDVQTNGPVSWLAQELSLLHPRPLLEHESDPKCGYGIIGELSAPLSYKDFLSLMQKHLQINFWNEVGHPPESILSLAYCPGSGMSLAPKAFSQGAQVFISGDLKYHQAQELERVGFCLDVGHFILEERMMHAWSKELKQRLGSDLEIKFFPGKNPMKIKCL